MRVACSPQNPSGSLIERAWSAWYFSITVSAAMRDPILLAGCRESLN
jgi:hypothetical protein